MDERDASGDEDSSSYEAQGGEEEEVKQGGGWAVQEVQLVGPEESSIGSGDTAGQSGAKRGPLREGSLYLTLGNPSRYATRMSSKIVERLTAFAKLGNTGSRLVVRLEKIEGSKGVVTVMLTAHQTGRVPKESSLWLVFREEEKELFETDLTLKLDLTQLDKAPPNLQFKQRFFSIMLGCMYTADRMLKDGEEEEENDASDSDDYAVRFDLPNANHKCDDLEIEWDTRVASQMQLVVHQCRDCLMEARIRLLTDEPCCNGCGGSLVQMDQRVTRRTFPSVILRSKNNLCVRLKPDAYVAYHSHTEAEERVGRIIELFEDEFEGSGVIEFKARVRDYVHPCDLDPALFTRESGSYLTGAIRNTSHVAASEKDFDPLSRELIEEDLSVAPEILIGSIYRFNLSVVFQRDPVAICRFLVDSPSHYWCRKRVVNNGLLPKGLEDVASRGKEVARTIEDVVDQSELISIALAAPLKLDETSARHLEREEKRVFQHLVYGNSSKILGSLGDFCYIWGEEPGEDVTNGSQHWIGKICYFWESGASDSDLFCCVRWMCQPCFTPLRTMRNPSEIFSTDQFCHDVNVNTIEWDSKKGTIAKLQVQHFANANEAEERFDFSTHDFFYSRKVLGNMGDEKTCPSFADAERATPDCVEEVTRNMLFPVPGAGEDGDGRSVTVRLKYDGRESCDVTLRRGDAIAFRKDEIRVRDHDLPLCGIILSFGSSRREFEARVRLLHRSKVRTNQRELLLGTTVLDVALSRVISLITVDFVDEPLPHYNELRSVEEYSFYCCRGSKARPLPPPMVEAMRSHSVPAARDAFLHVETPKLRVLDLFAGCGGFSSGLQQLGFSVTHACEWETQFVPTYLKNHDPEPVMYNCDVVELAAAIKRGDKRAPKRGDIDVVVGGPPCQGFSSQNQQRSVQDGKNTLVVSYLMIVKMLQPRYVMIENVPNFLTMADGLFPREISHVLLEIGYQVRVALHRASCFVPQARFRVCFIGTRSGTPLPDFCRPLHVPDAGRKPLLAKSSSFAHALLSGDGGLLPRLTLEDCCHDLVDVQPLQQLPKSHVEAKCCKCGEKKDHCFQLYDEEIDMMKRLAVVDFEDDEIVDLDRMFMCRTCRRTLFSPYPNDTHDPAVPQFARLMRVGSEGVTEHLTKNATMTKGPTVKWDMPVATILASGPNARSRVIYPETRLYWSPTAEPRKKDTPNGYDDYGKKRFSDQGEKLGYRTLSCRELARAQGFPDSFHFYVSSTLTVTRMIGNAVPPPLAYNVGWEMAKAERLRLRLPASRGAEDCEWRAEALGGSLESAAAASVATNASASEMDEDAPVQKRARRRPSGEKLEKKRGRGKRAKNRTAEEDYGDDVEIEMEEEVEEQEEDEVVVETKKQRQAAFKKAKVQPKKEAVSPPRASSPPPPPPPPLRSASRNKMREKVVGGPILKRSKSNDVVGEEEGKVVLKMQRIRRQKQGRAEPPPPPPPPSGVERDLDSSDLDLLFDMDEANHRELQAPRVPAKTPVRKPKASAPKPNSSPLLQAVIDLTSDP